MTTKRSIAGFGFIVGAMAVAIVTFRFPDLDIRLLGIGRHRNFLFHSAIVPLLALLVSRPLRPIGAVGFVMSVLTAGFLAGVGTHLVTDLFQTTAVKFPFIGSLVDGTSVDDRLWEGANAIVCFAAAWSVGRRQIGRGADPP